MTKPFLPIKHFQIYNGTLFILDNYGNFYWSGDVLQREERYWHKIEINGQSIPVPQCPPPGAQNDR